VLEVSAALHPGGNCSGGFSVGPVGKLPVFYSWNFHVEIDPVEQWSGDAGAIAMDHDRCAGA